MQSWKLLIQSLSLRQRTRLRLRWRLLLSRGSDPQQDLSAYSQHAQEGYITLRVSHRLQHAT